MPENTIEIRTYVGEADTRAFSCFAGFGLGQHYTGTVQQDERVLVSVVGAPMGTGVKVSKEEWEKWFKK